MKTVLKKQREKSGSNASAEKRESILKKSQITVEEEKKEVQEV